jgi:hypothetical protein
MKVLIGIGGDLRQDDVVYENDAENGRNGCVGLQKVQV